MLVNLKPRSHLADLNADLSRPLWSGEVLRSRKEVGKERGWVLEGPVRSTNLVEVPDCFELFKTIGSDRAWRVVVDRALGSRVRSLGDREHSWRRTCMVGKESRRPSQPTTHDWITSVYRPINDFARLSTSTQRPLTTYPDLTRPAWD